CCGSEQNYDQLVLELLQDQLPDGCRWLLRQRCCPVSAPFYLPSHASPPTYHSCRACPAGSSPAVLTDPSPL
nr:hypothetical protein [Tanacetum cinerariifolium]